MITQDAASKFAGEWIAAWNSHDLDRILSHYTDDFTIESPLALKIVPESKGTIVGKNAVRAYWKLGLQRIPDLHFELFEFLTGVNSITLYYANRATGKKSAEVMFINSEGKVNKVFAHYSPALD